MDSFTTDDLRRALEAPYETLPLRVLPSVDSTNLRLKNAAREGSIQPPFLLAAESQTAGRGRLGRRFVSPPGTGLYMSLLAPAPSGADCGKITILAAVAVCRAIEALTPCRPRIKWVNDLFVAGKKVCGILAEGVENGAVIGIGVNLRTPEGGFPPEASIAGALDVPVSRAQLAGRIASNLLDGLKNLNDPLILSQYRARMPLIGREIQYIRDGQKKSARVTGVDENGGLMVENAQGRETLRTGEITLGSDAFLGLK